MPAAATPTHSLALGVVTLLCWVFTASVGVHAAPVGPTAACGGSAPSAAACRRAFSSGISAWPCPAW